MVWAATTCVCSNGGGSDNSAVIVAAIAAFITFLVAAATFKTASEAKDATKATNRAADETAKEAVAMAGVVEVAQAQLRQAHSPWVVPVADTSPMSPDGASWRERMPKLVDTDTVLIPIANVGPGPALEIEAKIQAFDEAGETLVDRSARPHRARHAGLAANSEIAMLFERATEFPLQTNPFRVTIKFKDVFNNRYEVTGRFFPKRRMYRDVEQVQREAD